MLGMRGKYLSLFSRYDGWVSSFFITPDEYLNGGGFLYDEGNGLQSMLEFGVVQPPQ